MKTNKIETLTFWQWLHKYRSKIGLLAFIIAIPLTLLLITFFGPYFSNKSVHFDVEKTDVQRRFVGTDDLDPLTISIVWTDLVHPQYDPDDETTITAHGEYRFSIRYIEKGAYDITTVSVTPVLHTDWFSFYSVGSKTTIYDVDRSISVLWDETFPMHKLLFVTVNEPNLYLKVEYSYVLVDETITETAYVMFSLKDLNPLEVS